MRSNGIPQKQKGRLLNPACTTAGYPLVTLCNRKRYYVHALVLEAFVGPRPAGHETNHINGNKADNRLENLEWVSTSENQKHALANRLRKTKVDPLIATEIHRRFHAGECRHYLASLFGISRTHVYRIGRGDCWSYVQGTCIPNQQRVAEPRNIVAEVSESKVHA
jgi:hypothetical protein